MHLNALPAFGQQQNKSVSQELLIIARVSFDGDFLMNYAAVKMEPSNDGSGSGLRCYSVRIPSRVLDPRGREDSKSPSERC